MNDNRDENEQNEPNEVQPEPDFDQPPPEVTYVIDHKIPEVEKGQKVISEKQSDNS